MKDMPAILKKHLDDRIMTLTAKLAKCKFHDEMWKDLHARLATVNEMVAVFEVIEAADKREPDETFEALPNETGDNPAAPLPMATDREKF
jgi:hypothetical protein